MVCLFWLLLGFFRYGFPKKIPNLLFRDLLVQYFLFLLPFPTQQSLRVYVGLFILFEHRKCLFIQCISSGLNFLNLFMEGDGETSRKRKGKFRSCRRKKRKGFYGKTDMTPEWKHLKHAWSHNRAHPRLKMSTTIF